MKVIAVDFDGCLCASKWPDIGEPNWPIIRELIREQAEGAKLILWTCREGHQLQAAVMWCLNRGLKFDAINDNLPEHTETFGNNSRKVYADEYWDDKSVIARKAEHVWIVTRPNTDGEQNVKAWDDQCKIPWDDQCKHLVIGNPWIKGRWWKRWRSECRRKSTGNS